MLYLEAVVCPEKLAWMSHAWPLKPSVTVVTEHTRSHNNEMLCGSFSQLPNYEASILQPFEVFLLFFFGRVVISLSVKASHMGSLHSHGGKVLVLSYF